MNKQIISLSIIGLIGCQSFSEKPQISNSEESQTQVYSDSTSCFSDLKTISRPDFKAFYEACNVTGGFVLFDENDLSYTVYNSEVINTRFSPASTFKICNSLIGLETGVIENANHVLEWDGVERSFQIWNKDHDLRSAIKHSVVWYYQELARRVGNTQMQFWLDEAHYGNGKISGKIDKFWLNDTLQITPKEQVEFIKKLKDGTLPFSDRSMKIVKNIMITDQNDQYVIRSKTGWGLFPDNEIGWYVGYLETSDNCYMFANCIQNTDFSNQNFAKARIDITYSILKTLGIINE